MIEELISSKEIPTINLDKQDAKAIVKQLSDIQDLRNDIKKALHLVNLKMDTVSIEKELEIRITRDEFFNHILALFPNNSQLSKIVSQLKRGLPPPQHLIETSHDERPKYPPDLGSEEEKARQRSSFRPKSTQIPTAYSLNRTSKLLALNQKFLKGADGKYYLRDIGEIPNSALSSSNPITPQQAFDHQQFIPVPPLREEDEFPNPPQSKTFIDHPN